MASCNVTKVIPSNECIGDSLRTINSNFSALDTALCSFPYFVGSDEASFSQNVDFLLRPFIEIKNKPSSFYFNKFTSTTQNVGLTSISLEDGTSLPCYEFPYSDDKLAIKPLGSFEAVVESLGSPELTLYWTASGNQISTVYAVNSSINVLNKSNISPDGEVKCFYQDGNLLYIGGEFTKIGSQAQSKLAIIDLNGGNEHPSYGKIGSLYNNPLSSTFESIAQGSINCIRKFRFNNENYFVYGGNFKNEALGKGFFIHNATTDLIYPFFFNGTVNDILIDESNKHIFVVGQFDFCNYGYQPATLSSSQRLYCNNIAKIDIKAEYNINSLNKDFAKNAASTFQGAIELNCLEKYKQSIFVGGRFEVTNQNTLFLHKNFITINSLGVRNDNWSFITNDTVRTLHLDGTVLYVGGDFTIFASFDDFYNLENKTKFCSYAIAIDLANESFPFVINEWKPVFNSSVYTIITKDINPETFVFVSGSFTQLADFEVNHVAALTKAVDVFRDYVVSTPVSWDLNLDSCPSSNSKALMFEANSNSLFIGGTFKQINKSVRLYFAKTSTPQNIIEYDPFSLKIDFGGQNVTSNQALSFDYNSVETVRKITSPGSWKTVNRTTFPLLSNSFKNVQKNQLCRFFIRRPNVSEEIGNLLPTNDEFKKPIYIVGWSLNYKNK